MISNRFSQWCFRFATRKHEKLRFRCPCCPCCSWEIALCIAQCILSYFEGIISCVICTDKLQQIMHHGRHEFLRSNSNQHMTIEWHSNMSVGWAILAVSWYLCIDSFHVLMIRHFPTRACNNNKYEPNTYDRATGLCRVCWKINVLFWK